MRHDPIRARLAAGDGRRRLRAGDITTADGFGRWARDTPPDDADDAAQSPGSPAGADDSGQAGAGAEDGAQPAESESPPRRRAPNLAQGYRGSPPAADTVGDQFRRWIESRR